MPEDELSTLVTCSSASVFEAAGSSFAGAALGASEGLALAGGAVEEVVEALPVGAGEAALFLKKLAMLAWKLEGILQREANIVRLG